MRERGQNGSPPAPAYRFTSQEEFWGLHEPENLCNDAASIGFGIGRQHTSLILGQANSHLDTRLADSMLGVLIYLFHQSFPHRQAPVVICESHGRESPDCPLDWSRTVGWFTKMFPVQVNISWSDVIQTICRANEIWNSFPDRGCGWFAAQAMQNTSAQTAGVELISNYFSFLKASG
jgi:hypothetical protein